MDSKTVFIQSLVRSIDLLLCFFCLNLLKRQAFPIFLGFLLLTPTAYALEYSPDNPETISAGTVISVTGGCPPYTWYFSKCGVDFAQRTTEEPQNAISTPDLSAFCGTGRITVSDSCGNRVSGLVRSNAVASGWAPENLYSCIPKIGECAYHFGNLQGTSCVTDEISGDTRTYILNYDAACTGPAGDSDRYLGTSCEYMEGCIPTEYNSSYYGPGTLFTYYHFTYKWICNDAESPSAKDADNDEVSDCKDICPNTPAFGIKYINYEGCDPISYANVSGMELGVDSNKINPNCGQNFIGTPR